MSFYEKYELLDLQRDEGVKSFLAREIATGRPILVHLMGQERYDQLNVDVVADHIIAFSLGGIEAARNSIPAPKRGGE